MAATKNRLMLLRLSRLLVGALFIVSGLIKANDPIGFSYKLNDYFAPGVFNMPFLDGWALELSVLVCVAEIALGVAVLAGAKGVVSAWALLLMMVFFTFLTGYTAVANWFFDNPDSGITKFFEGLLGFVARDDISYMKDCGCFGDAIKLDPWESFLKDLVLTALAVIIFIGRKRLQPAGIGTDAVNYGVAAALIAGFSIGVVHWWFPLWFALAVFVVLLLLRQWVREPRASWLMVGVAKVGSLAFCIYCILHLPIKDFRPYRVGNNIAELRVCPPGAPQDVYNDTWFYKVNGVVGEYTTEQEPWNLPGAEFVDRKTVLVSKGCEPPIHDFVLEDSDGNDLTDTLLAADNALFVVTYNVQKANESAQPQLNALYEATKSAATMVALAANSNNETEDFRHKHQNPFDYLSADGTMLKTMIRSNPGLMLVQKGEVKAMWHHNDLPTPEALKALLAQ